MTTRTALRVESTADNTRFLDVAGEFLESRSVPDCVLFFHAHDPEGNPPGDGPGEYLWIVDETGAVAGVAYNQPPYRVTISGMTEAAAQALAEHLAQSAPWLPGVNGPTAISAAFAARFAELTGQITEPQRQMWVMACTDAATLTGRTGAPRLARQDEVEMIAGWFTSTMRDSGVPPEVISKHTLHQVGYQVKEGRLVVWENDESLIGAGGWTRAISGVVRPVGMFVLPEAREGGYAGALLSEVTRRALATGATSCVCILDLTYGAMRTLVEKVGYRQVQPVTEYRFHASTPESAG